MGGSKKISQQSKRRIRNEPRESQFREKESATLVKRKKKQKLVTERTKKRNQDLDVKTPSVRERKGEKNGARQRKGRRLDR